MVASFVAENRSAQRAQKRCWSKFARRRCSRKQTKTTMVPRRSVRHRVERHTSPPSKPTTISRRRQRCDRAMRIVQNPSPTRLSLRRTMAPQHRRSRRRSLLRRSTRRRRRRRRPMQNRQRSHHVDRPRVPQCRTKSCPPHRSRQRAHRRHRRQHRRNSSSRNHQCSNRRQPFWHRPRSQRKQRQTDLFRLRNRRQRQLQRSHPRQLPHARSSMKRKHVARCCSNRSVRRQQSSYDAARPRLNC